MDRHPIIINIQSKNKLVKLDPIENENENEISNSIDNNSINNNSIKIKKKLKICLNISKQITNVVDNVSLTNKNIIFTFWYLILCNDDINKKGFINIDEEYILDIESNINIRKEHFLIDILKKLKKDWHKQINKIDINFSKIKK